MLHQPVAHARPFPRAERDEVLGFDDFAVADEARWVEAERPFPVVGTDVELVVVEEHHRPLFDVVACQYTLTLTLFLLPTLMF